MGDMIERQDAIDAVEFGITSAKVINIETGEWKELFEESNEELRKAVNRLRQLPPAQPQHGQWIPEYDYYNTDVWVKWMCSNCRYIRTQGWMHSKEGKKPTANICEHCGADMREVEHEG